MFHMKQQRRFSPWLRIRSAYHRIWYELSQAIRWSRSTYHEKPAYALPPLASWQQERVHYLQEQYGVCFEQQFQATTALENYAYLDLLDWASHVFDWAPDPRQEVVDVGSLNFYYASVLHGFFHPSKLVGVELEGHRVYRNFFSRIDYAQFYIRSLPKTCYLAMNFCDYKGTADMITCFYPFISPEPLIGWRLPLNVFQPQALFRRMAKCLKPGGTFFMVNHGEEEAEMASTLAQNHRLLPLACLTYTNPLIQRTSYPVVSLWQKKPRGQRELPCSLEHTLAAPAVSR